MFALLSLALRDRFQGEAPGEGCYFLVTVARRTGITQRGRRHCAGPTQARAANDAAAYAAAQQPEPPAGQQCSSAGLHPVVADGLAGDGERAAVGAAAGPGWQPGRQLTLLDCDTWLVVIQHRNSTAVPGFDGLTGMHVHNRWVAAQPRAAVPPHSGSSGGGRASAMRPIAHCHPAPCAPLCPLHLRAAPHSPSRARR